MNTMLIDDLRHLANLAETLAARTSARRVPLAASSAVSRALARLEEVHRDLERTRRNGLEEVTTSDLDLVARLARSIADAVEGGKVRISDWMSSAVLDARASIEEASREIGPAANGGRRNPDEPPPPAGRRRPDWERWSEPDPASEYERARLGLGIERNRGRRNPDAPPAPAGPKRPDWERWSEPDPASEYENARQGLGIERNRRRNADPDLSRRFADAAFKADEERRSRLLDKKYLSGLSATEERELRELERRVDEAVAPFDKATIERVRRLLGRRSKNPSEARCERCGSAKARGCGCGHASCCDSCGCPDCRSPRRGMVQRNYRRRRN